MTRKRRYLISAAVFATCVCIALGVLAMLPMLPPSPGVTKANFDRIKDGMTLAEVEAILDLDASENVSPPPWDVRLWRHADGTLISISFQDNKVESMNFVESTDTFAKLRRWLHLPK